MRKLKLVGLQTGGKMIARLYSGGWGDGGEDLTKGIKREGGGTLVEKSFD